ncbi:MAG: nitroreductase/quinone reductase family protein [Nitrososphaerales archaeon]
MKPSIQEKSFIANLTTIGRKTGKLHTVPLRIVFYNNKFYASRRNMNGDWLNNLLHNPSVIIEINGNKTSGKASMVEDEVLLKTVSSLKYDDERASMERIIIEITPEE